MESHYAFSLSQCCSLEENGPCRSIGTGAIRWCGLVEVNVALLEDVCH